MKTPNHLDSLPSRLFVLGKAQGSSSNFFKPHSLPFGVANACGPSPQPIACRSKVQVQSFNHSWEGLGKPTLPKKSYVDEGAKRCQYISDSYFTSAW